MTEYDGLIKKIRFRRTLVMVLFVIAVLAALFFCMPLYVSIGSFKLVYAGLPFAVLVILLLVIFAAYFVALSIILIPVHNSMRVECDPKKYIALNSALSPAKMIPAVCAVGYTHLGEFARAAGYAAQMIAVGKPKFVISGYFNKARCEFLLGDTESLKASASALGQAIDGYKANAKVGKVYESLRLSAELMCAIADGDTERINSYRSAVNPWEASKSTECFVNFIKGAAAEKLGDTDECVYRMMWVRDNCPKSVFAWLADECLARIKESQ